MSKKISYSKLAEGFCLKITPRELGINNSMFSADVDELKRFYIPLILKSPSSQSMYGVKFSAIKEKFNPFECNIKINSIVTKIIKYLEIKDSFYFYKSFQSTTSQVKSLNETLINQCESCLCLKIDSGIFESLYSSIRNSLAHGDIVFRNGFYEFFSVKKEHKEDEEIDGLITFFLRIPKIILLEAYTKALKDIL